MLILQGDEIYIGLTTHCITQKELKKQANSKIVTYSVKNIATGNYSFTVRARTSAGLGAPSETLYFYVRESSNHIVYVLIAFFLVVIAVSLRRNATKIIIS